jgi:hypothetical protein
MGRTNDESWFDSQHGQETFLRSVQTGSRPCTASYRMGGGGPFRGGDAMGAWGWPLTCIYCPWYEWVEVHHYSPYAFMACTGITSPFSRSGEQHSSEDLTDTPIFNFKSPTINIFHWRQNYNLFIYTVNICKPFSKVIAICLHALHFVIKNNYRNTIAVSRVRLLHRLSK